MGCGRPKVVFHSRHTIHLVIDLYDNGYKITEIAAKAKLSYHRAVKILRDNRMLPSGVKVRWTLREELDLIKLYPTTTAAEIQKTHLRNKSLASIYSHASRLKIKKAQ